MTPNVYTYLWNKYRPAILHLMSGAMAEPQQYKLSAHEFRALNPKEKAAFTFTLEVFKGKALNNIKKSVIAQDLLQVLQESKRASELMNEATYGLSLDKHFVLHVNRRAEEEKPEPVDAGTPAQ